MLPIFVDVAQRKIMVVGRGTPAQQRLEYAHSAGAERIFLYVTDQDGWACHAEAVLYERLPDEYEFQGASIVFIAGLPSVDAARMAAMARAAGALVNVEDVTDLCDFHVPALVRRGDLSIAVSTSGKAPALAQKLKTHLSDRFGPEWEGRVRRIAEARVLWRDQGASKDEVIKRTSQLMEQESWLEEPAPL